MGEEPDRAEFLDELFEYMQQKGTEMCSTLAKEHNYAVSPWVYIID